MCSLTLAAIDGPYFRWSLFSVIYGTHTRLCGLRTFDPIITFNPEKGFQRLHDSKLFRSRQVQCAFTYDCCRPVYEQFENLPCSLPDFTFTMIIQKQSAVTLYKL